MRKNNNEIELHWPSTSYNCSLFFVLVYFHQLLFYVVQSSAAEQGVRGAPAQAL